MKMRGKKSVGFTLGVFFFLDADSGVGKEEC